MQFRLFQHATVIVACALLWAAPARAAWIDDFDDGDPLTNSTSIGWTSFAATSTSYFPDAGYDYPFVAEPAPGSGNPGVLGAGRDGEGWIEMASANGNMVLNTTAPVPDLDFFSAPTRLTFEHVNNQKYQNTELQAGVGGFSFVNSYLFMGSTQGRGGNPPSLFMDDLLSIDLLGLSKTIRLTHRLNGAISTLGSIDILSDDPSNPTEFAEITVSNMYTYMLDLDDTNVTLTVIDEATGFSNTLTSPHFFTLADWNAGSDGAYIGMASDSQLDQLPPSQGGPGPRGSTLSVGNVIAGIPPVTNVPGDFDGDGDVDGADFVVWQTNFPTETGATLATGDADGDGDVDGADFVIWQTNFPFTPSPGAAPVPEPNSVFLAAMGVLLVAARLRRKH